jgi:signal transduction histidine kinase
VGEIPVGERTWTVVCNPVEGYFEREDWSGQVIFVGGIAFTLLACVYLFAMLGRAQEVRRLVAQRTLELEGANAALNKEVTERRRAEHALQLLNVTLERRVAQRAAEAERRARDLEQFAYVASHDLKAPLRGIANLATWLKDDLHDKLTAETAEQIDLLRDRVARMNALVEGLLAYSRVGRTRGSVEEVDTAALVADTIDSLAPPSGFRVEVAPDMPRLSTDRLQLGQVFANLIGNAINHHDRDVGVVRVSGRELDERCEFEVSDDGPGIPPEYHDKVFMMFQTLTVKDFGSNTGIGLALVKKLVEEHGGTIRLTSGEGRGTSFTFTWLKTERERES